jgi:fibrillarin-like pre-rRNA processing protein
MRKILENLFEDNKKILTLSLVPGTKLFKEEVQRSGKKEYRVWSPFNSKACAAIVKGIKGFEMSVGSKILYLGAAQGYTPTFFSDIVGNEGMIYALEFSERAVRDLLLIAEKRPNIVPMHADARKPEEYEMMVEQVDIVYVDIAQPDQTAITVRNCEKFLKKGGLVMMAIKARSIDVTKDPKKVTLEEIEKLKRSGYQIVDYRMLDPFEEEHGFVIAKK